jgi:hypothetical protein
MCAVSVLAISNLAQVPSLPHMMTQLLAEAAERGGVPQEEHWPRGAAPCLSSGTFSSLVRLFNHCYCTLAYSA